PALPIRCDGVCFQKPRPAGPSPGSAAPGSAAAAPIGEHSTATAGAAQRDRLGGHQHETTTAHTADSIADSAALRKQVADAAAAAAGAPRLVLRRTTGATA